MFHVAHFKVKYLCMWILMCNFDIINLKQDKYMRASKFMKIAGFSPSVFKCITCSADNRLLVVSTEYVHPLLKVEFLGKTLVFKFYQKKYGSDIIERFFNAGYKCIIC
jgi:hypothetical protein